MQLSQTVAEFGGSGRYESFFCDPGTMILADNTTTAIASLDVSETTLANGIDGIALWNKQVLGAPLGFCSFGGRLVSWGNLSDLMDTIGVSFVDSVVNASYFLGPA